VERNDSLLSTLEMLFDAKRLVVLVARFGGSTTTTGGAITPATWR
jgi:hypothetical protein